MSDPQRELVKLAEAQGWMVEGGGSRNVTFLAPDGVTRVVASAQSRGARSLQNAISQLRRAGLDVPHASAKPKEKPELTMTTTTPSTNGHGPSMTEVANAPDAAVEMINELAEHFTTFRKATTDSIVELRGKVRDLAESKAITPAQLEAVTREFDGRMKLLEDGFDRKLDAKLEGIEKRVDPIGSFREKLRR